MNRSKNNKNKKTSMKWFSFVSRISFHKVLLGLILLSFLKGGSLLLLGGLPVLAPQYFFAEELSVSKEEEKEDILIALQAMRTAIAQATAEAAQAAEKKENTQPEPVAKNLSYSDQVQALKRRQQEVSRREQDLELLRSQLEARIEELKKLEASVKKMLEEADVTRDQKVAHLVDVYKNMKPQQAAQVLETLEDELAVKILSGMDGRTAGKILSYVKAKRAAGLSEKLTRLQIPFAE